MIDTHFCDECNQQDTWNSPKAQPYHNIDDQGLELRIFELNHQLLLLLLDFCELLLKVIWNNSSVLWLEWWHHALNPMLECSVAEIIFKNSEILALVPWLHVNEAGEHFNVILVCNITQFHPINFDEFHLFTFKLFHQLIPIWLKIVARVTTLHVKVNNKVLVTLQHIIEILNAIHWGA